MEELSVVQKRDWISNELKTNYVVNTKQWLPEQKYVGKTFRFKNSFKVTKLIDSDFYENPNLIEQYHPQCNQSTGSKLIDAVIDTAFEVHADKKITEAESKTTASFTVYAKPSDQEDYYLDVVFYNKSFNRPMENASLKIALKDEPSNFGVINDVVDSNFWHNKTNNDSPIQVNSATRV